MNIYCIGRNYLKHIEELGNQINEEPVIFLKSQSSVRELNTRGIIYPYDDLNYEVEIVLKIGRDFNLNQKVKFHDISHIALGIDLTRRDKQTELKKKGLPWTVAKSFLGAAILGQFYSFDHYHNQGEIPFWLKINGDIKQKSSSKYMLHSFLEICDYLNTFSPLQKGDLIFTGTPEGVGPIKMGDQMEFKLAQENIEIGYL
jgi:2-keto-4-pentenoate hydratase/2-oxohepta-3-ene-1,7-dioic acid hydratase in catechol pathway